MRKLFAWATKARAVASSVLVKSGILVCDLGTSLMFGLATGGACNFIRLCMRHWVAGRRTRLANAVEHRTRLRSFRILWRTPSRHHSASTQFFGSLAMLAP